MSHLDLFNGGERRPFLRRTKATAPPDVETTTTTTETTTNKFTRRGNNRFKLRNENTANKTSSTDAPARNDRPRNFIRRRLGGANPTTLKPTSSTLSTLASRRPFKIGSRRRPGSSTTIITTSTTAKPTTALIESEESLQDIGDIDAIEDPSLKPRTTPSATTTNIQRRRPLVQLKPEDQNPAASNDEEKKRQSKKFSSSFKQNQLDEILKLRASAEEIDITTEGKTTLDDISAETAVALAAHQLLAAPIPIIPDYDEDFYTTKKTPQTIVDYQFTNAAYTEDFSKTQTNPEFTRTPTYSTRQRFSESSTPSYTQTDETQSKTRPGFTTTAYTNRFSRPIDSNSNPTIPGVTLNLGSEDSGESTARFLAETYSYTTDNYESRVSRPGISTNTMNPTTSRVSLNLGESTINDITPTVSTGYSKTARPFSSETRISRPTTISEISFNANSISPTISGSGFSNFLDVESKSRGPSTARYSSSDKISVPVVFGYSTGGQGLREPSYFTREYLLESPVTKSYDDEYQYLSPVTTPKVATRKQLMRKTVYRRISTTQSPTSVLPQTTQKPRRTTRKPFTKIRKIVKTQSAIQKIQNEDQKVVQNVLKVVQNESVQNVVQKRPVQKVKYQKTPIERVQEPVVPIRPITDYDYYDDGQEKVAANYEDGKKVILHGKDNIECLDIGNFAHPTSCKKFISCARMESGAVVGWEYICPKGLSFDPVGGICNWSAGLGCNEKDM